MMLCDANRKRLYASATELMHLKLSAAEDVLIYAVLCDVLSAELMLLVASDNT